MPATKFYYDFFTGFVKANKIDLKQYDAVVGSLIQHGGNQMCVLHQNGQPSALAQRLRGQWTPVGSMIVPATPRGFLKFGGKLGPGIKTVGGSLLAIAISLFVQWLLGKFMESLIRSEINRQLANLEPDVQAKIKLNKSQVLFILAEGKKAFAELRFAVESVTTIDPTPAGVGSIAGATGFPTTAYLKTTVEITTSDEEVSLFRAYLDEIDWYNEQLTHPPSTEDMRRLTRDRDALQARLNAALRD